MTSDKINQYIEKKYKHVFENTNVLNGEKLKTWFFKNLWYFFWKFASTKYSCDVKQKLCYKKQLLVQKFILVSYLTSSDISSDNLVIWTNGNNKMSYSDYLQVIYVNFHNRKGLIRYDSYHMSNTQPTRKCTKVFCVFNWLTSW